MYFAVFIYSVSYAYILFLFYILNIFSYPIKRDSLLTSKMAFKQRDII